MSERLTEKVSPLNETVDALNTFLATSGPCIGALQDWQDFLVRWYDDADHPHIEALDAQIQTEIDKSEALIREVCEDLSVKQAGQPYITHLSTGEVAPLRGVGYSSAHRSYIGFPPPSNPEEPEMWPLRSTSQLLFYPHPYSLPGTQPDTPSAYF